MPSPWASFGGFLFQRSEHIIWGTDAGWVRTPSYSRQRPFGSATDAITTIAIGSAERTFEIILTPSRFDSLEMLMNSKALFTDWGQPPDSRVAFLTEVTPVEDVVSYAPNVTYATRKRRTRITLISA